MKAIGVNNKDLVEFLIKNGVDVRKVKKFSINNKSTNNESKVEPKSQTLTEFISNIFHEACKYENIEIIRLIANEFTSKF